MALVGAHMHCMACMHPPRAQDSSIRSSRCLDSIQPIHSLPVHVDLGDIEDASQCFMVLHGSASLHIQFKSQASCKQ